MPNRPALSLNHLAWTCALLALPAPASAGPPWTPPLLLDTRLPLEFAQPRQDPTDGFIYLPVLFQMPAASSLEMAVLDTSTDPPGYSSHVLATGSVFALGAAAQVGDRIGFSYVDTFFDGRFGTCLPPCTNPTNHSVSTGTYIDTASAGSADDYFVALLDNAANHSILTRYSTNGGTTWQTLHTTLPAQPGGVYANFQGGKRIALVVDPDATDPAQTRNCLFYEVRPAPGTTTALRLHCRIGAAASATEGGGTFNVVVDTDVPNGGGVFDKFIETNCLILNTGGGDDVLCGYSHRQTQQLRVVRVNESGGLVIGPTPVGAAPPGADLYGLTLIGGGGDDEIRLLHPDAGGDHVADVTVHPSAGTFSSTGPPGDYQPVTSTQEVSLFDDPITAFLWGFLSGAWSARHPEGSDEPLGSTTGLFLSRQQIPIFADGFDTGNRLRWSLTSPP